MTTSHTLSPQRRRERLTLGKKCLRCGSRAANAMRRCPKDGTRLVDESYDSDAKTELVVVRRITEPLPMVQEPTVYMRVPRTEVDLPAAPKQRPAHVIRFAVAFAATLGMLITLTACGTSTVQDPPVVPAPVNKPARQTAALTVSASDWQRLWEPATTPPPPMMMQPPPGPPPQEATDACLGKPQGGACSFTHSGMALSGTCGQTPQGQAVCMPAMMPQPPMEKVLGGTLAGLTSTPVLVQVRPTDDDRLKITATDFMLEPTDQAEGSLDLTVDYGSGPTRAGYYRRTNL